MIRLRCQKHWSLVARRVAIGCAALFVICATVLAADDPLPSWNQGPAREAIIDFVRRTTEDGSAEFVPREERIATFDQDGTLWVEQPIYTQVTFAIDRVKALAPSHPEWQKEQPFAAILNEDRAQLALLSIQDFAQIAAVSHSGMTVDAFHGLVRDWLAQARHPRFRQPYTACVYQPMLEAMRYLRASGYQTYIVTGGGQEFVRVYSEAVYGVGPERVIGSAAQTQFVNDGDGPPRLVKLPKMLLIDDKGGKPEGINLVIGRRPRAAFGNSTGDQQMLEWTKAGSGARLALLVHHDDAEREYAYGADSKIGTFSAELMTEARQRGWIVVSMQRDWKRIFAFEK